MTTNKTTTFDDARRIVELLQNAGFAARFAGGCVRDRLLGITPSDYDIATTARPEEVVNIMTAQGVRTIPTGIDHGTITALTESGPTEITTLRRDVKTDGRHAIVEFDGATFEDDALRRDFTINAMFEDLDGKLYDYHDGQEDLKQSILKFVGDPKSRIQEDYLRILRFFRFWSRFNLKPDPESFAAIASHKDGLRTISQERITHELWGVLKGHGLARALEGMQQSGITEVILPEAVKIDHGMRVKLLDCSQRLHAPVRHWTAMALMLGVISSERSWTSDALNAFGKRLRWSEKETKTLMTVLRGWATIFGLGTEVAGALDLIDDIEHQTTGHGIEEFYFVIWSFLADHSLDHARRERLGWLMATEHMWHERRVTPLPITGRDINESYPEIQGARIGEVLLQLRTKFRNGVWTTRQEGLTLLETIARPQKQV